MESESDSESEEPLPDESSELELEDKLPPPDFLAPDVDPPAPAAVEPSASPVPPVPPSLDFLALGPPEPDAAFLLRGFFRKQLATNRSKARNVDGFNVSKSISSSSSDDSSGSGSSDSESDSDSN